MKNKLVCPICGSDCLENYKETRIISETRKVLKNGRLSKKVEACFDDFEGPDNIHCFECNNRFNYTFDDKGYVKLYGMI